MKPSGDTLEYEVDRLACLKSYQLDTEIDPDLEELNQLAASICNTPVALIVLADENKQWFKSMYGWENLESERSFSFCCYTILEKSAVMEVENALEDDRFCSNPLVTGNPNIRYYCGAPLVTSDGFRIGSLCVMDIKPNKLTGAQKKALVVLSKQVITNFELHKQKNVLRKGVADRTKVLELTNNELKTFIYKAFHDIRGPLATIIGLADLGNAKTKEDEVQFYFKHINETGYRLDDTLRNLSKIMQLKDNELSLTDLNSENIGEAILKITESYANTQIKVEASVEPDILLKTDKELFQTILKYLIDNSFKYADESRKDCFIRIIVKKAIDDSIQISIQDNGEGIEEDIGNRIYDMFFRGNSRSKGSGLGLYITKKAVEKLNGEIHFSSVPFKLTTFTIQFKKLAATMEQVL